MTYEAVPLTVQTLVQLVAVTGGGYVLVRWQRQAQRHSQHLHVHGGSFDDVETEDEPGP